MARLPSSKDCSIAGCTYARYKGHLCRKHYALVPPNMYLAAMQEAMLASHRAAKRHHAKQLRYVRDLLKVEAA